MCILVGTLEFTRFERTDTETFGTGGADDAVVEILDLDLLAYDQVIVDEPDIIVPHPRLSQRSFVLMPWAQIAPNWTHPRLKLTVAEMLDALPAADKVAPAIEAWQHRS